MELLEKLKRLSEQPESMVVENRLDEINALIVMNCGPRKTRLEKLLTAYKIFHA